MTGQQRAIRWLAAGVLVLWCGGFLRAENTEKSMVRALILTPPTVAVQSWMVGLLYQFPEAAADVRRFAGAHFLEAQERIAPIRDGRKIWPHQPVEDVRAQDPQGLRRTVHDDGHGARLADRIDEERDHRDVVQMGVGDEDMIDAQQVFELEVADPSPRIDQNVVIHEQGRGALTAPPDATTAPKNPQLHFLLMEFRKRGNRTGRPSTR